MPMMERQGGSDLRTTVAMALRLADQHRRERAVRNPSRRSSSRSAGPDLSKRSAFQPNARTIAASPRLHPSTVGGAFADLGRRTKESVDGYAKFANALYFDAVFGRLAGRPW